MRKIIKAGWKYIVLLVWFLLSVAFFEYFLNRGNTDMTQEISKASLPVVAVRYDGHDVNKMFGYTKDIEYSLIRDGITPLSEDRSLSFRVYKKNNNISSVTYELRSVDGSRFIESGEAENREDSSDCLDVRLVLKDLILEDTEYMLKITVTTISGKEIYYYARIVENENLSFDEKVDFVYYFSECTFDKERAQNELVKYLESNKSGDNTNFNHINIHSSLDMVTWSNLETEIMSEPVCYIEEIDGKSAIMKLEYVLKAGVDNEDKIYAVEERYRFIKGSDRMYLMEFDRYMDSLVMSPNEIVFGDKLMLGICNEDFEFKENESGNTYAFVNKGSLYVVNSKENTFVTAYSSYDADNCDDRCLNDNHDIKILDVDDDGNVRFYVYGYFNNGNHEGRVGIDLLTYNLAHNIIEETIFIEYDKSYQLLKSDIEKMSYLNTEGDFYAYIDNCIYSIDTATMEFTVLEENISFNDLYADISRCISAWPSRTVDGNVKEIAVLNEKSNEMFTIKAVNGEALKPIGFMGEDFIYGKANISDISVNLFDEVLFPMNTVNIIAKSEAVMKKYEEDNVYVTDCKINDNLITLTRMQKNEDGEFESIAPDSIVNIQMESKYLNNKETVATENLKKIVQISLKNEMDKKKMKNLNPKIAVSERLNEVVLPKTFYDNYYVFMGEEKIGSFASVSEAVNVAEANLGVVTDREGHYIWKKETYRQTNQIMKITGTLADDENSSLETCIETVLEYEGYSQNVKNYLKNNESPAEIFEKIIPESEAIELVNVSSEALKYYLNRDIPIIAAAGSNSLLLIGYNDSSFVWMNPQSGNVMKVSNEEAERFYEKFGRRFLVVRTWDS